MVNPNEYDLQVHINLTGDYIWRQDRRIEKGDIQAASIECVDCEDLAH